MTHRAAMIDLETLALTAGATIISGAVVVTDLDNPEWNYDTPIIINYKFYLTQDRHIDPKTLEWHLSQPAEVIAANFGGEKVKLEQFLLELASLPDITTYWSKGVDFDISILEHAYKKIGKVAPWSYRQKRCFRTVEAWMLQRNSDVFNNNPYKATHTADSDAFKQAWDLHSAYHFLHNII